MTQQNPRRNGQHDENPARPQAVMEGYTPSSTSMRRRAFDCARVHNPGPIGDVQPTVSRSLPFPAILSPTERTATREPGTTPDKSVGVCVGSMPMYEGPRLRAVPTMAQLETCHQLFPSRFAFPMRGVPVAGRVPLCAVCPARRSAAPPPPRIPATVLPFTPLKYAFSRACRLSEAPTPAFGIGPQSRSSAATPPRCPPMPAVVVSEL